MLRDYQIKSIDLIREEYLKGITKTCLVLPTGAGKSVVACEIIKTTIARGKRVIFVVRGVSLIDQISKRLFRENTQHGVVQANHWNFRPTLPVQVISIDTAIARDIYPEADLIIIDECDQAVSDGYKKFLSHYPNAFILGITATPYTDKSLRHVAESAIVPITMQELIDQKYLSPFRYFAVSAPDLSGVKVSSSTNDYVSDQLEGAMVANGLTGKVVDHYIKYASDRPTLLFAVNVHHSKLLADNFNDKGIRAEHADANTSLEKRNEIFARLESRETKIVCTVGIATRGFDAPFVSCLILARPTKSLNLHRQMLGRGTRLSEGKIDNLILDHANNLMRLGFPTDEVEIDLDGKKAKESHVKETKVCKSCFCCYRGPACPECGATPPEREKVVLEESDDELREMTDQELDVIYREYIKLQARAKTSGRNYKWAMYKLVDKFGIDLAKKYLPESFVTEFISKNAATMFRSSRFKGAPSK